MKNSVLMIFFLTSLSQIANAQDVDHRGMNACVIDLCGMPDQNKSSYLSNANYKDYFSTESQKKIERLSPQLNKMFNTIQNNKINRLKEIENLLIINGKLKYDSTKWSKDFTKQLSYQVFSPYIQTTIDYNRPIHSRFKVNLQNTSDLDSLFKKSLETYASLFESYVLQNSEKFQELGLYSNEEMKTIIKNRIIEINKFLDSTEIDPSRKNELNLIVTRILEDSGEYSDVSANLLMLNSLEGYIYKISPGFKKLPESPNCETEGCMKVFENYLTNQNYQSKIIRLKNELQDPRIKVDSLNRCKTQLIANIGKEDNQKKAEKLVEEVKIQMSKNVFSKFSTHSKTILQNYFSNKIHTVGKPWAEVFGNVKSIDVLDKKISQYLITISSKAQTLTTEEQALQSIIKLSDEVQDPYESTGSPCNPTITSNAKDAFISFAETMNKYDAKKDYIKAKMPLKDLMFISDFSCQYDVRGRSVVAHELGHAINQIFATQKLSTDSAKFYNSLRKCATENYMNFKESISEFLVQPGDGLKTEEDTADLFAYMTYPKSNDLFSCALIKPGTEKNTYAALQMENSPDSPQSSPLYRLILEAVNKGVSLPGSCVKALTPYKEILRFKKCIP